MILKLFTQSNCPKCPKAKKLVEDLRIKNNDLRIEKYDITDVDGLAEASFYSVLSTPGIILCDNHGKEVKGWRGETPNENELTRFLNEKVTHSVNSGLILSKVEVLKIKNDN